MVDTLTSVVTSLSMDDNNYSMWNKVQLLVILPCTKLAKDNTFFGNKEITLNALVHLFQKQAQWTQYMVEILKIVTINNDNEDDDIFERVLYQQLFP